MHSVQEEDSSGIVLTLSVLILRKILKSAKQQRHHLQFVGTATVSRKPECSVFLSAVNDSENVTLTLTGVSEDFKHAKNFFITNASLIKCKEHTKLSNNIPKHVSSQKTTVTNLTAKQESDIQAQSEVNDFDISKQSKDENLKALPLPSCKTHLKLSATIQTADITRGSSVQSQKEEIHSDVKQNKAVNLNALPSPLALNRKKLSPIWATFVVTPSGLTLVPSSKLNISSTVTHTPILRSAAISSKEDISHTHTEKTRSTQVPSHANNSNAWGSRNALKQIKVFQDSLKTTNDNAEGKQNVIVTDSTAVTGSDSKSEEVDILPDSAIAANEKSVVPQEILFDSAMATRNKAVVRQEILPDSVMKIDDTEDYQVEVLPDSVMASIDDEDHHQVEVLPDSVMASIDDEDHHQVEVLPDSVMASIDDEDRHQVEVLLHSVTSIEDEMKKESNINARCFIDDSRSKMKTVENKVKTETADENNSMEFLNDHDYLKKRRHSEIDDDGTSCIDAVLNGSDSDEYENEGFNVNKEAPGNRVKRSVKMCEKETILKSRKDSKSHEHVPISKISTDTKIRSGCVFSHSLKSFASPSFNASSFLDKHMDKADKKFQETMRKLKCPGCNKQLYTKKSYDCHMKRHIANKDGKASYLCVHCQKQFSNYKNFTTHILNDHPKTDTAKGVTEILNKMKCNECDKQFYNRSVVYAHNRKHLHSYLCDLCAKSFKAYTNYANHLKYAHKNLPRFCNICDKTVHYHSDVKCHKKEVHNVWTYNTCMSCNKSFDTVEDIKQHLLTVHGTIYPISSSNTRYSNYPATITEISANEEQCLVCPYCGNRFDAKKTFHYHLIDDHSCFSRYQCEYCVENYENPTDLSKHLSKDHGQEIDEESLKQKGELQCNECYQPVYLRNIIKHLSIVHSHIFIESCKLCGLSFNSCSALNTHLNLCHPEEERKIVIESHESSGLGNEEIVTEDMINNMEKTRTSVTQNMICNLEKTAKHVISDMGDKMPVDMMQENATDSFKTGITKNQLQFNRIPVHIETSQIKDLSSCISEPLEETELVEDLNLRPSGNFKNASTEVAKEPTDCAASFESKISKGMKATVVKQVGDCQHEMKENINDHKNYDGNACFVNFPDSEYCDNVTEENTSDHAYTVSSINKSERKSDEHAYGHHADTVSKPNKKIRKHSRRIADKDLPNYLKRVRCKYCELMFAMRFQLREHLNISHFSEPDMNEYMKEICERKDGSNLKCSFCDDNKKYTVPLAIWHLKQKHKNEPQLKSEINKIRRKKQEITENFLCLLCTEKNGFIKLSKLIDHLETDHEVSEAIDLITEGKDMLEKLTCDLCKEEYPRFKDVYFHKKKLHGLHKQCCHICGEKISTAHILGHLKKHKKDYPELSCNMCDAKYNVVEGLVNHRRSVHQIGLVCICSVCDSRFHTGYSLKQHMEVDHADKKSTDDIYSNLSNQTRVKTVIEDRKPVANNSTSEHGLSPDAKEVKLFQDSDTILVYMDEESKNFFQIERIGESLRKKSLILTPLHGQNKK